MFIFAFISMALGDWSKKTLLQFTCLHSLLGVLWCQVYYKSLSHSEFILKGYGSTWMSSPVNGDNWEWKTQEDVNLH